MEENYPNYSDYINDVYEQEYASSEEQWSGDGMFNFLENSFLGRIWNYITGKTERQKEFARQEYLMDKENIYNSPVNQMNRYKEAGINPLTAAAGIAQGGNESAQAPAVAHNASTAAGLEAVASAPESIAQAIFTAKTTNPTVSDLKANVSKKLKELGLTDAQIRAFDIDNMYKDSEWQKKLALLDLQADDYVEQWDLMHSQWSLNMQEINESLEKIKLMQSEEGVNTANKEYLEKLKEKTDLEAQWMQIRVDFWKERGFDILTNSKDMAIVQMLENGKNVREIVDELVKIKGQEVYEENKQRFLAEQKFQNATNMWNGIDKLIRLGINELGWLCDDTSGLSNYQYKKKLRTTLDGLYEALERNNLSEEATAQVYEVIDGINAVLSFNNTQLIEYRKQPREFRKF